MASLTPTQYEIARSLEAALAQADHGAKGAVLERFAATTGLSPATLARMRKAAGFDSGRKRRVDAGTTSANEDDLRAISTALCETYRKTGRRIMTFDDALTMLRANGKVQTDLSSSQLARVLRARGLHPEQLARPEPAIEQRSEHPNHVWQVDASVATAFYLSNAQGLEWMDEAKFYKNKEANLTRIQQERLVRYTVADHFSHNLLTRYYLGSECAAHLTDFLIWAFAPKDGHPMHGVPFIVQMDMGSANTSAMTLNLLERLQVRVIVHERHNSRANGSVEKAHHLVERHFESYLRFAHVADLADINAKALAWAHAFGATRAHSRHKETRHSNWMRITADQLRLAPELDVMRDLVQSRPEQRRVSFNLTVDFKVKGHGAMTYDVRHVPGVMAGEKVTLALSPYRVPAIDVEYIDATTGETAWMTVAPLEMGADGRRMDAPVIGRELRSAPLGVLEHNRDRGLQIAYGGTVEEAKAAKEKGSLVFGGEVDPFKRDAEIQLPAFLSRRGTAMDVARRTLVAQVLTHVEAAKRLKAQMGDAYSPQIFGALSQRFPDGVPEDQLDGIAAQFHQPEQQAAPAAPVLRAVG